MEAIVVLPGRLPVFDVDVRNAAEHELHIRTRTHGENGRCTLHVCRQNHAAATQQCVAPGASALGCARECAALSERTHDTGRISP